MELKKKQKIEIPELPDRGNLGFLISKLDPAVVDYRKSSLKKYLQEVLNNENLKNSKYIRNFLCLN